MSDFFDVLWLNVNPSFKRFSRPLLKQLAQQHTIAQWQYCQTQDEASCLDKAVVLLHEYLQQQDRPLHLIGHGMSGTVGILFARQFPSMVKSLTLLSVGAQPALTWQAHYYVQRQMFACLSREQVLAMTVRNLWGNSPPFLVRDLVKVLNRDLYESPSLHSLHKIGCLPKGEIDVPLMICSSQTDSVVPPPSISEWQQYLKPGDFLWHLPTGGHFFQFFHPDAVANAITSFWQHHPTELAAPVLLPTMASADRMQHPKM
jgi:pimeloyl-ACP methyl ester carboxylesterase